MMENVCEQMIDIVGRDIESLNQRVVRNLNQKLHDDEFWSKASSLDVSWDDDETIVERRLLSLKQVIECVYALCDAIVDGYELLSRQVMREMRVCCRPPVSEEDCGIDGIVEKRLESAYGVKLYLRRLYLLLKSQ